MIIINGSTDTMKQGNIFLRSKMNKKTSNKHSFIIAMVAPVGTDLDRIESLISKKIGALGCEIGEDNKLDITSLGCFKKTKSSRSLSGYDKCAQLMKDGDDKRENSKWGNAALAQMISEKIIDGHNYIIHQLKTPEEVNYLRTKVNKDDNKSLFVVSVFDTKENRTKRLEEKLRQTNKKDYRDEEVNEITSVSAQAQELISRDEKDSNIKHGQNVRGAFPLADFFIDGSLGSEVESQVDRVIKAIFCYPHLSPTIDEYGMYLAEAGALRSRDLSRQVGAAILDDSGCILAIGCNEVPKAFGGMYWENDSPDNRDYVYDVDSNYKYRNEILEEFLQSLCSLEQFSKKTKDNILDVLGDSKKMMAFLESNKANFKDTRIMNLIEFGRSMHAEIAAVSEAARKGIPLRDSILYTTVFPCHLCARYIISVGIKKIIFIEPYPKSLTTDLYSSEMALLNSCECNDKIVMKPFIGIAPRIYRKVFSYHYEDTQDYKNDKKYSDGKAKPWHPNLSKWFSDLDKFKKPTPKK